MVPFVSLSTMPPMASFHDYTLGGEQRWGLTLAACLIVVRIHDRRQHRDELSWDRMRRSAYIGHESPEKAESIGPALARCRSVERWSWTIKDFDDVDVTGMKIRGEASKATIAGRSLKMPWSLFLLHPWLTPSHPRLTRGGWYSGGAHPLERERRWVRYGFGLKNALFSLRS